MRQFAYWHCGGCDLRWLDPAHRLGVDAERAHYDTHENSPDDPGYRAFLDRLAAPLCERLPAGAEGLDFGAGPGPTLSVMLTERGHPTAVYDPFYAPDAQALERTYDFVTCTETAEHFHEPAVEFARLSQRVRPGGWLGVMTKFVPVDRPFGQWHYLRDPTHVSFYSTDTLQWIARSYGWSLIVPRDDVALFHVPRTSTESGDTA